VITRGPPISLPLLCRPFFPSFLVLRFLLPPSLPICGWSPRLTLVADLLCFWWNYFVSTPFPSYFWYLPSSLLGELWLPFTLLPPPVYPLLRSVSLFSFPSPSFIWLGISWPFHFLSLGNAMHLLFCELWSVLARYTSPVPPLFFSFPQSSLVAVFLFLSDVAFTTPPPRTLY